MSTPTTLTSSVTGLTYEVYAENDDHLYIVNDSHTILICNIDDDIKTILEDHERKVL